MIAIVDRRHRTPHTSRSALAVLALLLALAGTVLAGPALAAPGHTTPGAQNCARASLSAALTRAPATLSESSCTRPGSVVQSARIAVGCCVAAKAGRGGAGPVRVGQAGEAAVRGAYDIGPKATQVVNGRTRIFDGLTDDAVSEVKNVKSLSYTQQLKDSLAFAQQSGRRFDLYVRGGNGTSLSGPLAAAIRNGDISLRYIP